MIKSMYYIRAREFEESQIFYLVFFGSLARASCVQVTLGDGWFGGSGVQQSVSGFPRVCRGRRGYTGVDSELIYVRRARIEVIGVDFEREVSKICTTCCSGRSTVWNAYVSSLGVLILA